MDKFGIYVPNNPNYKLKDIKGDEVPKELDTINLYKYYGYYDDDNLLVLDTLDNRNWKIYDKYCSNGRVYGFGTDKLEEKKLNPNYGNKGYYIYNKNRNEMKYEVFTNGNGGQFVILKCRLSKNGDTITFSYDEKYPRIYVKEIISKGWKRYKPDW